MRNIEGRGFTIEYDEDLFNLDIQSNERGVLQATFEIRKRLINDFFEEPDN